MFDKAYFDQIVFDRTAIIYKSLIKANIDNLKARIKRLEQRISL